MQIWILTALASEAEGVLKMRRGATVSAGFTGMGAERARRFVERLDPRPSRIVFGGIAGGLDPALATGDLVIATRVTDGRRTLEVAGAERMAVTLERGGVEFRRGAVFESSTIMCTPEEKRRAAQHGSVVAMEDLAIVEAAHRLGSEISVIRVVLDGALETSPARVRGAPRPEPEGGARASSSRAQLRAGQEDSGPRVHGGPRERLVLLRCSRRSFDRVE
jgi:adenosylhomocysteine nucleosidase